MNQKTKLGIFQSAKSHAAKIQRKIKKEKIKLKNLLLESEKEFSQNPLTDRYAFLDFARNGKKRLAEFEVLRDSPYFVRCDVVYAGEKKKEKLYFSKFQLSGENIFSWVSPAASIRFEEPGDFSFRKPDGKFKTGRLLRKDQFVFARRQIIFLATEQEGQPRELIFQKYFSQRKTDFVLPEIVAQMEKAQDQVVRARPNGPFLISGPAGSGKTTLALHRAAYLISSPDMTEFFALESIAVFVQDEGTREYFSALLPQLGIENVLVLTFAEWAARILKLEGASFPARFGNTEDEKDQIEERKIQAFRTLKNGFAKYSRNVFAVLGRVYADENLSQILQKQKAKNALDRIDLTALLLCFEKTFGELRFEKEEYFLLESGRTRRKKKIQAVQYSLVVVDEFQNYLPAQLELLKRCVDPARKAVIYVGELAQQVRLGTVRAWSEIGEEIEAERAVTLQKVYRNTREILEYIKSLGFEIEIPEASRQGRPVVEKVFSKKQDEIEYVRARLAEISDRIIPEQGVMTPCSEGAGELPSVGILAKEREYLDDFKAAFGQTENLRIFSIREAQGVEFDAVFLVGIKKETFTVSLGPDGADQDVDIFEEKKRIQKNLLYIALTRAVNELHVLGREKLARVRK